jgi:AcrR family transcriptional regulator
MSRWEPDARGRLEKAAFELYLSKGYEQTTVADIAERAGLSERTFFRHFTDKREVLFSGSDALKTEMLRALEDAPASLPAIDAVRLAVEAAAAMLPARHFARERQRIVAAHPHVQERELIKRASLTNALAEGLERRGVAPAVASLAADMGMGVFHVGFARWLDEPVERAFVAVVRDAFDQLKAVASGT